MPHNEGELQRRIKKEFNVAYDMQYSPMRCQNNAEVAGMVRVGLQPNIERVLKDVKAALMPERPDKDDYEMGIPSQEEQYKKDVEYYKKFVWWFGV